MSIAVLKFEDDPEDEGAVLVSIQVAASVAGRGDYSEVSPAQEFAIRLHEQLPGLELAPLVPEGELH